jgi:ABC-type Fe3+ transport system substrate-binding protein
VIEPVLAFLLKGGKNRVAAEKFVAFLQSDRAKAVLAEAGVGRKAAGR